MPILFFEYPSCDTCRRAKKWLDGHQLSYTARHIVENNPTKEELTRWIGQSELPVKSFFNTSGLVYKSLQLKDKLPHMSDDEQIALLASDGKLIKRPLLIRDNLTLTGFRPDSWETALTEQPKK